MCHRAHNTLFISELASQRHRLPEELRALPSSKPVVKKVKKPTASKASTKTVAGKRTITATVKFEATEVVKRKTKVAVVKEETGLSVTSPQLVAGMGRFKSVVVKRRSATVEVVRKDVDVPLATGPLPKAGLSKKRSRPDSSRVSDFEKIGAESGSIREVEDSTLPSSLVIKMEREVMYSAPLIKVEQQ